MLINPADSQSATRITLTAAAGALATNVAAVKFDFTNPASENGYCGYSQIELFGTPFQVPLAANETNITYYVSSNNITVAWPADHIGWQLEVQTNTSAAGIGTNWIIVAGSSVTNQMLFPINPANGAVFFRLSNQ